MFPASFDAAVVRWFSASFAAPTPCQSRAWAALAAGRHTLVAAPTGSGKTLAAFLTALSDLAGQIRSGTLAQETTVVYVSPLKALSNDIQRNLERPLAAIQGLLAEELGEVPTITTAVRTGDTSNAARTLMRKRPPHILVTTPESLYILLTSASGRAMLRTTSTVIVDEIHALVSNKRGAHLLLSLARLDALTSRAPLRIGLSATQRPIARVAEFLTGRACGEALAEHCAIVDEGHQRARDLAIEMPPSPLETVVSGAVSSEIRARMIELISSHRSTLVFVNTRRMAERLARALADELGDQQVCAHHGSMSRERRLDAERRLKQGHLKALVATASLELGIDIGDVDLVCQLGTTRSLSMLLQRVGRSGHAVDGIACGRVFPQTRDELIEAVALLDMIARDELDSVAVPPGPRDVLAQQIVAEVAMGERSVAELYAMFRATWPYRELTRLEFDAVLRMLAEGFSFAHGRRSAYLHLDDVNGQLSARRGAKLTAVTCGGAIPDNADYDVIAEPQGEKVGTVNEDFAIESLPGNIFQLGNTSWRVLRVESSGLRVEDAQGEPPNMPFWLGEAPSRSAEMSHAVARLRQSTAHLIDSGVRDAAQLAPAFAAIHGVGAAAARQAAEYLLTGYLALGAMPTQDTLVMERFFDESGGMQLVIHSPFGSRLNKAWGLALRKRFCRTFNYELQAAAVEDAIVLSLGAAHSFALDEVWRYLNAETVRDVLIQAVLAAPLFAVRWRWVAGCALAIERFRAGRKTAPRLLRMNADDLAALVFPDQLACAENLGGRREVPDHPLVKQAIDDCLHEAMDIVALEGLLGDIAAGRKQLIARDLTEPSPFALQVLNANPYAFLDDAPLEERRTQAVSSRRWLDSSTARDLAALDPAAIARVREEVWPTARTVEELHEALQLLGFVAEHELTRLADVEVAPRWLEDSLRALFERSRAVALEGAVRGWLATERRHELQALHPHAQLRMNALAAAYGAAPALNREQAVTALVRSRLEFAGPTTAAQLASVLACEEREVEHALLALEQAGIVMRGQFSAELVGQQWCERRLLARIHRYTLNRLRQEIEAVPAAAFMRFLCEWQSLTPSTRLEGSAGLQAVLSQLSGYEAPVAAWESDILPARLRAYDSRLLDEAIRAGRYVWLRLSPKRSTAPRLAGTLRTTPVSLVARSELQAWLAVAGPDDGCQISGAARQVLDHIEQRGAAFFDDIVGARDLLRSQVENALDELAAAGLVTCDSFVGLRALTTPLARRNPLGRRARRTTLPGIEEAGRWAALARPLVGLVDSDAGLNEDTVETIARILLRRYGVVFRRVLEREAALPPWRLLLRALRRMEAAGEIRGGRFVAGATGEQFAVPDAVAALRECAKRADSSVLLRIAAVDPLNLVGSVLPGVRVAAQAHQHIALLDGEAVATRQGADIQFLKSLDTPTTLRVRTALIGALGSRQPGLRARKRLF